VADSRGRALQRQGKLLRVRTHNRRRAHLLRWFGPEQNWTNSRPIAAPPASRDGRRMRELGAAGEPALPAGGDAARMREALLIEFKVASTGKVVSTAFLLGRHSEADIRRCRQVGFERAGARASRPPAGQGQRLSRRGTSPAAFKARRKADGSQSAARGWRFSRGGRGSSVLVGRLRRLQTETEASGVATSSFAGGR